MESCATNPCIQSPNHRAIHFEVNALEMELQAIEAKSTNPSKPTSETAEVEFYVQKYTYFTEADVILTSTVEFLVTPQSVINGFRQSFPRCRPVFFSLIPAF